MTIQQIGIIHPGEMGISVAATAQKSGHQVYWASEGRSAQTHERAAKFNLHDVHTVADLCATCSVIVSVCPPHAAADVAQQTLDHGFTGMYLDANAIAPRRVVDMSRAMTAAGVTFVDGGIIGGPAWTPGTTRLYLSGPRAGEVAACFSAGPLETRIIGADAGKASALKMCYAAYSKGTTALLGAVLAAAEQLGVRGNLQRQWAGDDPAFANKVEQRLRQAAAKAWRFEGEMDEIAATFRDAGLPGEFHAAAALLYRRLAAFKAGQGAPALEELLTALRETGTATPLRRA
jgi:3-hydroxyisobutyrate dehydrogenase-like beta-hydroxyacid dehydrogenase